MKLPFWIIPAHWGLRGKAKEIAKINYNYSGYEADLLCADLIYLTDNDILKAKNDINLKYNKINEVQHKIAVLDIELKFNRITEYEHKKSILEIRYNNKELSEKEYDYELIELLPEGDDKKKAAIECAFKYHEITESEYSKELYTLRKEPWMDFNVDYNAETNQVEFIFDYNEFFWKKLKSEGHPGNDEEEIIENFIRDWGRKIASDEYTENEDVNLTKVNDEMKEAGLIPDGYKLYK